MVEKMMLVIYVYYVLIVSSLFNLRRDRCIRCAPPAEQRRRGRSGRSGRCRLWRRMAGELVDGAGEFLRSSVGGLAAALRILSQPWFNEGMLCVVHCFYVICSPD